MLAHAASDLAPTWLLVATLVVGVALTWTWLRTSWTEPRLARLATGRLLPERSTAAVRGAAALAAALGLTVWALTLTAGLFADTPDRADNLATYVGDLPLLGGGALVAFLFGDWWRAASPFATLARLVPDRPSRPGGPDDPDDPDDPDGGGRGEAPGWTGPALLATFAWLTTAFHDGEEPRAIGIWLAAYTIAVLAGTARWGRRWVRSGEGFASLFGVVARLAPLGTDETTGRLRVRRPFAGVGTGPLPPGAEASCLITIGTFGFAVLRRTEWWRSEVVGDQGDATRTVIDTIGLGFTVGLVAVLWLGATRRHGVGAHLLVPLTIGVVAAFQLSTVAFWSVDTLALLSDPFGRGWNLLGTADWYPDVRWPTSARLAWAELLCLLTGTLAGVVLAHDESLAAHPGKRAHAERALLPALAAGTVLAVAALLVLLG